ncbi:MAG: glycosyltransferase family 39 protein [Deltaproteobacteria bacterium]|nr:glycosyltransferase family 39 protein [Deltaproteobacteria bacterium]
MGWPRSLAETSLLFLSACLLISLVTWPWVAHLGSAVSTHWDVGLHAWKLNWNAQRILDGHWLVPSYHGNFYYPQAYTLALDDLFWVPSYFAALVLGLSHNAILTYNLTFLFFWALSSAFMYLLLRELDLGRASAVLGALAFCLLPYMASYYIEFNGELCFGIPLVLWLLLRFFKKPGLLIAILVAIAFWMQAVSALYYTTILGLTIPLVALPLLRERAELVRSLRFWLSSATSLVVVAGLSWLFLYPYLLLHNRMELERNVSEMALHSADALTYLRPCSGYVPHTATPWPILNIPAALTEAILWPGLVVVALALVYWYRFRWLPTPGDQALAGGGPAQVPLRWGRAVFLALFWAWCALATFTSPKIFGGDLGDTVLNVTILGVLGTSLAISLLPSHLSLRGRFVAGLTTAALLCFFISLGPNIRANGHQVLAQDWVVYFFSDAGVLGATRVLSRYAVLVLFALVVVAAIAFESLNLKRSVKLAALILALVFITLEADIAITNPYRPLTNYPDPALELFLSTQEPCTLMVLPIGNRILDSAHMLKVAGASPRRFLVNGWTGFQHVYAKHLSRLFSSGRWEGGLRVLGMLWPHPLIVVDREALGFFVHERGHKVSEQTLRQRTKLLFEDKAYAVFEPQYPPHPTLHYERRVRQDLLERAKAIHFWAREAGSDPQAPAWFYINDGVAARLALTPAWHEYNIKVVDPELCIPFNTLSLIVPPSSRRPLEVKDFHLVFK